MLAIRVTVRVLLLFQIFSATVFANEINVVVYAENNYPPYSYEEEGELKGIYTKILKKVFSRMKGYRVDIKAVPWKRGLIYLETGKGFALYPPYYRPKERPYIKPYSVPILDEKVVVFCTEKILEQSRLDWPEDYYGLTIGNNRGFKLGGDKFWKAVEEGKIRIQETDGNRRNILKLGFGRVDCYMNDRFSIIWELNRLRKSGKYANNKLDKLKEGTSISSEQGFLGFTDRDNGNFYFKDDFVKKFNVVINKMKKTGEVQKIIDDFINK